MWHDLPQTPGQEAPFFNSDSRFMVPPSESQSIRQSRQKLSHSGRRFVRFMARNFSISKCQLWGQCRTLPWWSLVQRLTNPRRFKAANGLYRYGLCSWFKNDNQSGSKTSLKYWNTAFTWLFVVAKMARSSYIGNGHPSETSRIISCSRCWDRKAQSKTGSTTWNLIRCALRASLNTWRCIQTTKGRKPNSTANNNVIK